MSMQRVNQALVKSLDDLGLGIPIAWENFPIDPPNDGSFADVTLIPATPESLGKLVTDADEMRGIFQVSIYTPANESTGGALAIVDTIIQYYRHNRTVEYNGQKVNVMNTGRGVGRNVNGWYVIDISINFRSDLERIA